MVAIIVDSALNGLKRSLTAGVKLLRALAEMTCSWVESVPDTWPQSFPGPSYIAARPRLDQQMITSRGPGGSLTLIIVDMKDHRRSHERKYPVTPLSNPPLQQPSELQSALFCPCCLQLIRPQRQHLFSWAKMPNLWIWPCPDPPPPSEPYVQKELIIKCLSHISILWYASYCLWCRGYQSYRRPPGRWSAAPHRAHSVGAPHI